MSAAPAEIDRRRKIAKDAIKAAYGTPDDELGATLFVSHHLKEIGKSYWENRFQTTSPEPAQILEALVFVGHWGEDDDEGIDVFDFTLPGEVTNYMISVLFDEEGKVEEITMES